MIRIICDKCHAICEENYYTVNITCHDVDQKAGVSLKTATHNHEKFVNAINGVKPVYCESCMNRIKDFLT